MAETRTMGPAFTKRTPGAGRAHPTKKMLMTPLLVFFGGLFAFAIPTLVAAFFHLMFFHPPVSNEWTPITANANRGRVVFMANGCLYCHSGYTRPQDVNSRPVLPLSTDLAAR